MTATTRESEKAFWKMVAIGYSMLLALVVILLLCKGTTALVEAKGLNEKSFLHSLNSVSYGWSLFWAGVVHFLLSWRVVDTTERGLVVFYGKPIRDVRPGPTFVPWLICQLRKVSGLVQQFELPGEPEKVWRKKEAKGKEEAPVQMTPADAAAGWVEPIRINFDDSDPEITDDPVTMAGITGMRKANATDEERKVDPLNSGRVTVEVPIVIRYRVRDFETFLLNIGSIGEAKKQLSDMAIAETIPVLEIGTLARAQANRATICKYITQKLGEHTADWGIEIEPVRLKPFIYSRTLNVALQEIPEAKAAAVKLVTEAEARAKKTVIDAQAEADKTVLEANAERYRLEETAQGEAELIHAKLDAEAKGLKDIMDQTGCTGAAIVAAETSKVIAGNVDTLNCFGKDGMSELLKMVTAGSTVVRSQGRQSRRRTASPVTSTPTTGGTPPATTP